jgi:hypothetical protein
MRRKRITCVVCGGPAVRRAPPATCARHDPEHWRPVREYRERQESARLNARPAAEGEEVRDDGTETTAGAD